MRNYLLTTKNPIEIAIRLPRSMQHIEHGYKRTFSLAIFQAVLEQLRRRFPMGILAVAMVLFAGTAWGQTNTLPASGNVGIGTTAPQTLLDIQPSTDGVTSLLLSQQNCLVCGWGVSAQNDGVFRLFRSDNPTSILSMLYNNGNVGIGTTTPQERFHLFDSSGIAAVTAGSGSWGNSNAVIQSSYGTRTQGTGAALSFAFPANTDGTDLWEQARIVGTPDNNSNSDAHGRMYLQTRTFNAAYNAWVWANNLVLTSNGNVGVGTTTPSTPLEVNGGITMTPGSNGVLTFADGTTQSTGLNVSTLVTGSGNLASNYLQINANNGIPSYFGNVVNGQNDWSFNTYYNGNNWIYATTNPTAAIRMGSGVGMMAFYTTIAGEAGSANATMDTTGPKMSLSLAGGLSLGNGYTTTDPGAGSLIVAGKLGIGTTLPGASLEVNGSVKLTAGSGASLTFPDASVQSTAWNGVLQGGDYAESVDVSGNRSDYEPGDVLVVDRSHEGHFVKSSKPYSTTVIGIYSTRPGIVGRRQKSDRSHMVEEVPMAMIGVVPTKVTDEGGSIEPGDLLVTSSKPGYAMKGTDRSLLTGAIIGKSLGHLDSGRGLIEVAVSLQ